MMLTAAALHPVIAAWCNRRERAALRRELRQLEQSGELDATLADIGLSRGQLETLLASDPAAADLLPRMMRRFRFGPGKAGIIPFLRGHGMDLHGLSCAAPVPEMARSCDAGLSLVLSQCRRATSAVARADDLM
jgi:uncharacterized protein YjiS (DUF1127 family)